MNVHIWVRNPYIFRYEEYSAIAETLRRIYGVDAVYMRDYPVDYVSVDNVNITTARKMADLIKAFHLQAALKDRNFGSYRSSDNPAFHVEVEIRGIADGRPDWARSEKAEVQQ